MLNMCFARTECMTDYTWKMKLSCLSESEFNLALFSSQTPCCIKM